MKQISILLSFLLLIAFFILPTGSSQVIILNQTEPDLYGLSNFLIYGDLESDMLEFTGSGEVISGSNVKIYLFGSSKDILITDLIVNNEPKTVSFDNNGYFFVSQKGIINIKGKIYIRSIGQLRLYVPGPMNELSFDLSHGYAVEGTKYGLHKDTIIIQRTEKVAMSIDGNFHFSYTPLKNDFNYLINFRSFGSTLGKYELPLFNGEQIQSVSGAIKWSQEGSSLILELSGEKASVVISGVFSKTELRVPLTEGTHNVLIESDPEKKISISTPASEIDISESTMSPKYSNARTFLATTGQKLIISVEQLGLIPSLVAVVDLANQRLAITPEGGIIGDITYRYKNTGVDYLFVDIPGTPLYAGSIKGPLKLTKDSEDNFLLAFPKTNYGSLDIVYYDTIPPLSFFSIIDLPTANLNIPITEHHTSIFIPNDYIVIDVIGAKGGSELPSFKNILIFFIILSSLGFLLFRRWIFAFLYLIFSIGIYYFDIRLFFILIGLTLVLSFKRYLKEFKWSKALIISGIVVGSLIVVAGGIFFISMFFNPFYSISSASSYNSYDYMDSEVMIEESSLKSMEMDYLSEIGGSNPRGSITVPTKTGVLPVKMNLPYMGKTISVYNNLITVEHPISLRLVLLSSNVKYILYLITIIIGYFLFKEFRNKSLEHKV